MEHGARQRFEKRISFQFCSPADEVGETFTLSVLCLDTQNLVFVVLEVTPEVGGSLLHVGDRSYLVELGKSRNNSYLHADSHTQNMAQLHGTPLTEPPTANQIISVPARSTVMVCHISPVAGIHTCLVPFNV